MKHLKLFESLVNKKEIILDVFQDMEDDYDIKLEVTEELELEILLKGNIGLENGEISNKLYGYLLDVDEYKQGNIDDLGDSILWVDPRGLGVGANESGQRLWGVRYENPSSIIKRTGFTLKENPYYQVTISGDSKYISDNIKEFSEDINSSVFKLREMYDILIKDNKAPSYKNGAFIGGGRFYPIDWTSSYYRIGFDQSSSSAFCCLNIYFK